MRIARHETWSRDLLRSYQVFIDGARVGGIRRRQTRVFPLPVGEHRLHLKIDWYATRDEAFTVRPGETVDYWCWHTRCPSGPAKPFRSLQGKLDRADARPRRLGW